MHTTPALFDQTALKRARVRAAGSDASVWFLHEIAADHVSERLKEINRTFTAPVIVGWQAQKWAEILGFDARCIPDDEVLDLPHGQADLIIHALCLHSHNDPVGQLIQMQRGLRPDGLMIAVLFAGETLQELRDAFTHAEALVEGGISPRIAPMADIRGLGSLLQRAGFSIPVADTIQLNTSYETPLHLMRELRAMGEVNIMAERRKSGLRRKTLTAMLDHYHTHNALEDNRIAASFELAFLTGWHPDESQQKPLRPGSAQVSLVDFLNSGKLDEPDNKR